MDETRLNADASPPRAVPCYGWAWGLTRAGWGEVYISQGHGTNDCAPSNGAMVINAATGRNWRKIDVLPRRLGWPFPAAIHGATHPRSLAKELNRLAGKFNLPLKAKYGSHGTKEQLLNEIKNGNPVTVIKIWSDAEAHYVTIVSYDKASDTIFYMDPSHEHIKRTISAKVQQQSWENFQKDWSRQVWWTKLLGLKNEMIVYRRISG